MLGSKTVALAAGLFTAALINRSLGPSLRGVYAEMQTWMGLFAVLFGFSMDTAIYHFTNSALYRADPKSRLITTLLLSFVYGSLGALALTSFVLIWPENVSSETVKYLWFLDGLLISTMVVSNLLVFLQATGHLKYSAIIGLVQGILNAVLIGFAYLVLFIDIQVILIALLILQAVAFLMLIFKFKEGDFLKGQFLKGLAKGIVAAGAKQHLATIATFVYTKVNQLILFRYCGDSETGMFSVSLSAAFYLMFIPMTFQTVLYPRVILATDDYEVTMRSLRLGFYGWGGIVLLMTFFAKPILFIYGGQNFLPAVTSFRILMIATWFLPLSSLVAPYCIKKGAFFGMATTAVVLGLVSIALNLYLIPNFLGRGAALATAATCVIGFGMSLLLLWYLSKRNPLEFMQLRFY